MATDGQSVSNSWCRAPSGAHDWIFITVWQLRSCFCGALSLTRGRVSFVYAAGPCQRTHSRDRILLSQISDFPFRRLIRLAGSRWRYSTRVLLSNWILVTLLKSSLSVPIRKHLVARFVFPVLASSWIPIIWLQWQRASTLRCLGNGLQYSCF
jgi:hypothetical protein